MKLLSFLLVFLGTILACSAAAIDINDLSNRAESSQAAKCKKTRDCVIFKACRNGQCVWPGNHQPRDKPRPEPKAEPESPPESGPEAAENELKADKLDINLFCQKDADCGNGFCLEHKCVDAAVNDDEDEDSDGDCKMHIEARTRKPCNSDSDCPKDKRCSWGACRTPIKITHSARDNENPDDDDEMHILPIDLDAENDSQLLSKRDDGDNSDYDNDSDDPEAHLFTRAQGCKTFKDCDAGWGCKKGRCQRWDCATRPGTCDSGRCKNGKCIRSLEGLTIETDDDDENDESDSGISERSDKYPAYCKSNQDCPPKYRCYSGGVCKYRGPHLSARDDEDDTIAERDLLALRGKYPAYCKSNQDCPPKYRCYPGGVCKYRPPHLSIRDDEDNTILERQNPRKCESKKDCSSRYRCHNGTCKYGLSASKRDEDTAILERDHEALNDRQCNAKKDCPVKFRCVKGKCKFGTDEPTPGGRCKANNDCPRNQKCLGGVCKSRSIPSKRDESGNLEDDEDYDSPDDEGDVEE
ncbi:uncharacterized protein KD926_000954 [Aspergillus affinis]|uniref:uncharacterized protein n=1 Tax=Aspergillus affinis TaxID=1070780 RepID=UPI0022FF0766|nr:uncharacterized protein KD926_000954 [Aspergillus affinis]KAI9044353.1 hypothetical protein KD926_000954 [Aspergillus affinis]